MLKLNQGVIGGVALAVALLSTSVNAATMKQQEAQLKAAIVKAALAGITELKAAQDAKDAAAANSDICKKMKVTAVESVLATTKRAKPPDPAGVIKNSTCFFDVASIKIPIILTGFAFLDDFIQSQFTKYLTGGCAKAQNYLKTIQKEALAELNAATKDVARDLIGSANEALGPLVGEIIEDGLINPALKDVNAYTNQLTKDVVSGVTGVANGVTGSAATELQQFMDKTAADIKAANKTTDLTDPDNQAAGTWSDAMVCKYGIGYNVLCPPPPPPDGSGGG